MRLLIAVVSLVGAVWLPMGCGSDSSAITPTDAGSGDTGSDVGLPNAPTPCGSAAECQYEGMQKECRKATCDLTAGHCVVNQADDGDQCMAGNACYDKGTCTAGQCVVGKAVLCDDGIACTIDSCDITTGCLHKPLQEGADCDDGNVCTVGDQCTKFGLCAGTKQTCDDGEICTNDSCNPVSGACENTPTNGPCDDGKVCTNDSCVGGKCLGVEIKCDDGNFCTIDKCVEAFGGCVGTNSSGGPCNDGDGCTVGDTCDSGICKSGTPQVCNDGNVCTAEKCSSPSGTCVFTKSTETQCNDGNLCTENDLCDTVAPWVCKGGKPLVCDDGNVCTSDSCTGNGGCAFTPNNGTCDDNNSCTVGDTCVAKECQPSNLQKCDDNNPCTTDSCSPITGCIFDANSISCTDGNSCTLDDKCANKSCVGVGVVCNDNNPCTTDWCSPDLGCQADKLSVNATCNDGNGCTGPDLCDGAGKCSGKTISNCDDGNSCTDDSCNPTNGSCVNKAKLDGSACTDNNACSSGDACKGGICAAVAVDLCNDNVTCTVDICNPANGACSHTLDPNCK